MPSTISETIKGKCGDTWLQFSEFKTQLEEEIYNLRAFPQISVERTSTVSTFSIEQNQAASLVQSTRYKNKGKEYSKGKWLQKKRCALCDGSHFWIYCKIFATRERKLEKLKSLELFRMWVKQTLQ